MLRCNEVTRLYASDTLRTTSWRKRVGVGLHLMMCKHCRRYVRELKAIGAAARAILRQQPDDPARMEDLVRRVAPKPPTSEE